MKRGIKQGLNIFWLKVIQTKSFNGRLAWITVHKYFFMERLKFKLTSFNFTASNYSKLFLFSKKPHFPKIPSKTITEKKFFSLFSEIGVEAYSMNEFSFFFLQIEIFKEGVFWTIVGKQFLKFKDSMWRGFLPLLIHVNIVK